MKNFSLEELLGMVAERQTSLKKLMDQRKSIDAQIQALGGSVKIEAKKAGVKRGRPAKNAKKTSRVVRKSVKRAKNEQPLSDVVLSVLTEHSPLRVKDIVTAVEARGYKSNGSLYACVAAAVNNEEKFTKVSRGLYGVRVVSQTQDATTVVNTPNEVVTAPVDGTVG